jgi:hypothetical protein
MSWLDTLTERLATAPTVSTIDDRRVLQLGDNIELIVDQDTKTAVVSGADGTATARVGEKADISVAIMRAVSAYTCGNYDR